MEITLLHVAYPNVYYGLLQQTSHSSLRTIICSVKLQLTENQWIITPHLKKGWKEVDEKGLREESSNKKGGVERQGDFVMGASLGVGS